MFLLDLLVVLIKKKKREREIDIHHTLTLGDPLIMLLMVDRDLEEQKTRPRAISAAHRV